MEYLEIAKKIEDEIIKNRRWLHTHAEVGFNTPKTLAFIRERLIEYGYKIEDLGRAGVRVCIGNGKERILLRADVDGLPIEEKSGVKFACKSGNMHACGHDIHAAILLGVAKLLKAQENKLTRSIEIFFQVAEERLEGASVAIQKGLLENKTTSAITLHVLVGTEFESGCVIIPQAGVTAPSADYFEIRIKGKSCHGSAPQDGVDATLVSAHLLLGLEELISREIGGRGLAVMTVGRLISGSAGNVISDLAVLEGTLRTLDEGIRERLKKRLVQLSKSIAKSFLASASVEFTSGCPSLLIDEEVSTRLQKVAVKALGEERVIDFNELPKGGIGGSEDFAYISREIPSGTFALCAGKRSDGYQYPLHHSKTKFDENALVYGLAVMLAFALEK